MNNGYLAMNSRIEARIESVNTIISAAESSVLKQEPWWLYKKNGDKGVVMGMSVKELIAGINHLSSIHDPNRLDIIGMGWKHQPARREF